MRQPRIAIILDENTSTGGTRYEAAKGYFRGVSKAGGIPFGIPYLPEVVDIILNEFDGLVSVGGRFAYPDDWYISGEISKAPPSERLEVETIEEYVRRAVNVCGMACLKMILAARGDLHPTLVLARGCTAYGGYVINELDASIKGLIYAPFVTFVRKRFELSAETMTGVATRASPVCSLNAHSSSPRSIAAYAGRNACRPQKAGTTFWGRQPRLIRSVYNPSGHDAASQADVTLPLAVFDHFFANHGISIGF